MESVIEAFKDPTFRFWYVNIGFAIMVLPMAVLSWWYHSNIKRTPGGQALMAEHRSVGSRNVAGGRRMMRDVARGKYGGMARHMQNRVAWVCGIWVLVLVVYFGLVLWADEVNRVPI